MHIQRQTAATTLRAHVSTPFSFPPKKKEIDFERLYKDLLRKGFKPIKDRYGEQEPARLGKMFGFFSSWLQGAKENPDEKIDLDAAPKKIYVDWGGAVIGTGSVLLGTDGIASCSALSVIDTTNKNIHYLFHAFPMTYPKTIKNSLEKARALGINLKDSEIGIMPGSSLDSESTPHILEGLYLADSNLLDKTVLIRDSVRGDDYSQAIIVYEGKTFGLDHSTNIPTDQRLGCNPFDTHRFNKDGFEVVLTTSQQLPTKRTLPN